jgi:tetratricopeptide (TPR) repeat protein
VTGLRLAALLAGGAAAIALGAGAAGRRTAPPAEPATTAHTEAAREFWGTYRAATALRMKEDFEGAAGLYRKALSLRPNHEDSLYYLGNAQLERGAYADALHAFQQLAHLNPSGSSRAYMQWGLVHASLEPGAPRDFAEAQRLLQLAFDTDPESGALLALGEVALLRGRTAVAQDLIARAGAENPMSMAAPYLLGYLARLRRESDEAWRLFRLAVERGELKKPPVAWSEEGDVKADPALRWRALARQSVFGDHWIRLRAYVEPPGPTRSDMDHEYRLLDTALAAARTP